MSFNVLHRYVVANQANRPLHSGNSDSATKDWMYGNSDKLGYTGLRLYDLRQSAKEGDGPLVIDEIESKPPQAV